MNTKPELKLALFNDVETLFNWQQEPAIRQYARNPKPPTWEEHVAWFQNYLSKKDHYLYIIQHNHQDAGVLRLDKLEQALAPLAYQKIKENDTCMLEKIMYEISIFVAPEFQGQGIAANALKTARQLFPKAELFAEVLPENTRSLQLFIKLGYQEIQKGIFLSEALVSTQGA